MVYLFTRENVIKLFIYLKFKRPKGVKSTVIVLIVTQEIIEIILNILKKREKKSIKYIMYNKHK